MVERTNRITFSNIVAITLLVLASNYSNEPSNYDVPLNEEANYLMGSHVGARTSRLLGHRGMDADRRKRQTGFKSKTKDLIDMDDNAYSDTSSVNESLESFSSISTYESSDASMDDVSTMTSASADSLNSMAPSEASSYQSSHFSSATTPSLKDRFNKLNKTNNSHTMTGTRTPQLKDSFRKTNTFDDSSSTMSSLDSLSSEAPSQASTYQSGNYSSVDSLNSEAPSQATSTYDSSNFSSVDSLNSVAPSEASTYQSSNLSTSTKRTLKDRFNKLKKGSSSKSTMSSVDSLNSITPSEASKFQSTDFSSVNKRKFTERFNKSRKQTDGSSVSTLDSLSTMDTSDGSLYDESNLSSLNSLRMKRDFKGYNMDTSTASSLNSISMLDISEDNKFNSSAMSSINTLGIMDDSTTSLDYESSYDTDYDGSVYDSRRKYNRRGTYDYDGDYESSYYSRDTGSRLSDYDGDESSISSLPLVKQSYDLCQLPPKRKKTGVTGLIKKIDKSYEKQFMKLLAKDHRNTKAGQSKTSRKAKLYAKILSPLIASASVVLGMMWLGYATPFIYAGGALYLVASSYVYKKYRKSVKKHNKQDALGFPERRAITF
ncbi:Pv-fam-d protein [Plasmodium vivax Brazil I]|uniref:Pv-fam-d protein n=1 Tax=Plasmodium vivax (strain Brazil I) TaxID=1033975 RepID=A0A0J9SXH6_PLAV1|nr:Pv-fam-d protein, variant [Plasmodium vivax Brazil I]KMZ87775.1 Pv-fam-d protein [Plasmodium vivax Brazil I]